MVGFIYAGTTGLAILYTWFCVGETSGRTRLEISLFFTEKIPVRAWRTHVFSDASQETKMDERTDIEQIESVL